MCDSNKDATNGAPGLATNGARTRLENPVSARRSVKDVDWVGIEDAMVFGSSVEASGPRQSQTVSLVGQTWTDMSGTGTWISPCQPTDDWVFWGVFFMRGLHWGAGSFDCDKPVTMVFQGHLCPISLESTRSTRLDEYMIWSVNGKHVRQKPRAGVICVAPRSHLGCDAGA